MSIPVCGSSVLHFYDGNKYVKGSFILGGTTNTVVPAGKRLVIEFVAIEVPVPSGQKAFIIIKTTIGGYTTEFRLAATPVINAGGYDIYQVSQPVKLYADPGTEVGFFISRMPGAGESQIVLSFSGYYENI